MTEEITEKFSDEARNLTFLAKGKWEKSPYAKFLRQCTRQEFMLSQQPFYYAVARFPDCLIKLASLIPDNEKRLPLIENIWEEHGRGGDNEMHQHTFMQVLHALGFEGDVEDIPKSPAVTHYFERLFKINDANELATRLGAIECVYAVISQDIAGKLNQLGLSDQQGHYSTHKEIDWDHGKDLVSLCDSMDDLVFMSEQRLFIELMGSLAIPTKIELDEIASLNVSFTWMRESFQAEEMCLGLLGDRGDLDVFCVTSGGEHAIQFARNNRVRSVTAFDVNPHQNDLAASKVDGSFSLVDCPLGKFERLFMLLGRYLSPGNSIGHVCFPSDNRLPIQETLAELRYALDIVFSNHCLKNVFGEDAVMHSSPKESFPDHFYKMFIQALVVNGYSANIGNICNLINGKASRPIVPTVGYEERELLQSKIDFVTGNLKAANLGFREYDIIDLSNIGDWMSFTEFDAVIETARAALKPKGVILCRRLLGDYSLEKSFLPDRTKVVLMDDTYFYSEVVGIFNELNL